MRNTKASLTLASIVSIFYQGSLTDAFTSINHTPKVGGVATKSSCESFFAIASASSTQSVNKNDDAHDNDNLNDAECDSSSSRRSFLFRKGATVSLIALGIDLFSDPSPAHAAKTECMTDCLKNCKLIAPKDPGYCNDNCSAYCAQEDRTDGLSGSVSSTGGEVGILGTGTVVKGEDKPPVFKLPGLDFNSEKGRKLIGY